MLLSKTLYIILFCFQSVIGLTQPGAKGRMNTGGINTSPYVFFDALPSDRVDEEGSEYYYDEYAVGEVCFKGSKCVEKVFFRVNLLNGSFEFMLEDGREKFAKNYQVESYSYQDPRYPNEAFVTQIEGSYLPISNFKIISNSEKCMLIEEVFAEAQKHEYNEALALTDRRVTIQKSRYFWVTGGEHIEVKKSISSLADIFKFDKKSLKKYIKENSLDIKENEDFAVVVEHLTSNS